MNRTIAVRMGRSTALVLALSTLAACGAADNDPGPGGVTVGEAKALDAAAAMLDARRAPEDLVEASGEPAGQPSGAVAPSQP